VVTGAGPGPIRAGYRNGSKNCPRRGAGGCNHRPRPRYRSGLFARAGGTRTISGTGGEQFGEKTDFAFLPSGCGSDMKEGEADILLRNRRLGAMEIGDVDGQGLELEGGDQSSDQRRLLRQESCQKDGLRCRTGCIHRRQPISAGLGICSTANGGQGVCRRRGSPLIEPL